MARTRNLEIVISGDTRDLNRAFAQVDKGAKNTENRLGKMGKAGALAFAGLGAAAAGAAVVGLKKATDAAIEAEKAQARMTAQLKASGISYRAHAREIDNVIQKTSRLAGIDDEDLQDAFTNIVRSTGSVSKGLANIGLAADIARAKHIDVAKAGQLLGRVATGNVTALSRYGIQIDKNATSSQALAELQRRFAGQAEAYGKTTAGSMERAGVAAENLGEAVGAKLAPLVARGANALTNLIDRSGEAAGPIRRITGTVSDAYNTMTRAISRFVDRNRAEFAAIGNAARAVGNRIRQVFGDIIVPAVRAAVGPIKDALGGIVQAIRGLVRIVTGILTGDWRRAWRGLDDVVRGALKAVSGVIRGAAALLGTAAFNLGKAVIGAVVRGIKSAAKSVAGAIKDTIPSPGDVAGALNPFGDGVGKRLVGAGGLPSLGNLGALPGGKGSLDGANAALSPFAGIAARMGLHTTSGRRNTTTLSGNLSYHATGNAIDEAGPFPAMHRYAQTLYSKFGGRLRELISPWPELGIKNGRPFRYSGPIQAQHSGANAHVHVAYTGGVGDGIGDVTRLARAAGFKGQALINAIAVAGAESGFRSGASNRNTNGSVDRGYWQINSIHGARSTFDPMGNARAAFAISSGGRNWRPWVTYNTGAYRRFLGQARAAAGRSTGAGTRGSTGTILTSRGGGGSAPARDTTSPYELAIAGSDVAIAEAQQGGVRRGAGGRIVSSAGLRETQAQYGRLGLVNRRIASVRKRLATAKTRAGKLRLRNELAQLYGERNTITGRITELRTPPEVPATDGGGDGGGGGEGDPNQALIDAINAKAEQDRQLAEEAAARAEEQRRATEEHTAAVNALKDEQKRAVDLATSATASSSYQAWKALADIMSGQLGARVVSRGFTASTGVSVAY